MTIDELVAAASRATFDEASVAAIQKSISEAEMQFEKIARDREMTQEVLALTCSL